MRLTTEKAEVAANCDCLCNAERKMMLLPVPQQMED